jgi:hypothetical protein
MLSNESLLPVNDVIVLLPVELDRQFYFHFLPSHLCD